VLVSSGTVLAAIGLGGTGMTSAALYYLVSSTLTVAAFFLLVELVERGRTPADDVLAVTLEAYGAEEEEAQEEEDVGVAIPAIMAVLGIAFLACALLLAGLPPLSGFIAKFALISSLLEQHWLTGGGIVSVQGWILLFVILVSSLATVVAVTRAGMRTFWTFTERELPLIRGVELGAVAMLLFLCVILTVQAGPVMRFMQVTAHGLELGRPYIGAVQAQPGTAPLQKERAP